MGNTISYIGSHGKRLLNRYNAQFRALKFLDKEKLPSAPRHALSGSVEEDDPMLYDHLIKKDPSLDKFLKDVYIKSYDEKPLATDQKNPLRPLPSYSEVPKDKSFQEPVEMVKGFCTLSQFFDFRSAHENDPVRNSASIIAKNYCLDVKKVENLLKYYSVFNVYEIIKEDKSKAEDKTIGEQLLQLKEKLGLFEQKELESQGKSRYELKGGKKMLQLESQEREILKPDKQEVKN